MVKTKNNKDGYQPEWISAIEAARWLDVDMVTLFRWRQKLGLNWTNINGKTVMYDKRQINEILNQNSTYRFQNIRLLSGNDQTEK